MRYGKQKSNRHYRFPTIINSVSIIFGMLLLSLTVMLAPAQAII